MIVSMGPSFFFSFLLFLSLGVDSFFESLCSLCSFFTSFSFLASSFSLSVFLPPHCME